MIQHFGHFGTPEIVHTDRGTAFHNELIAKLLRVAGTKQSLTMAYSKEENAIVERANKEVLRHLNALLFDARVRDKWSYEQLPMVQRIMNTVEKTSTGVIPADLILNNAIRLEARILAPPPPIGSSQQVALSDTMDEWIARLHTLITVARDNNSPAMHMHSSNTTRGSPSILSTRTCSLHLQWTAPTSSCPDIAVPIKKWRRQT